MPVGIGGLLILAYGYIDQVLVYELAGARDAGLYGAVYKVLERMQFIPATVLVTLFPILVAARDVDPARVDRVIQSAVDFLLITALPPLAITLAGARAAGRAAVRRGVPRRRARFPDPDGRVRADLASATSAATW